MYVLLYVQSVPWKSFHPNFFSGICVVKKEKENVEYGNCRVLKAMYDGDVKSDWLF